MTSSRERPICRPSSPAHSGFHSFYNQAAFKFTNSSDNDNQGATERAARIDALPKGNKLNIQVIEFIEHLKKVTNGTGDPVECPHDHSIESPPPGIREQRVESGALRLGSADLVGVLAHDFVAACRGHLAQIEQLRLDALVEG